MWGSSNNFLFMAKKLEITITLKSVDKTLYSSVTIQMKPYKEIYLFFCLVTQLQHSTGEKVITSLRYICSGGIWPF